MKKELAASSAIAFLDMLTTYISMKLYGTCELEMNPVLRSMCERIGYNAVWVWLPAEVAIITLTYKGLKEVREALGVKANVEDLFLALAAFPVVNNIVMIACAPTLPEH
jgi:hypothetical protein